MVVQWLLKGERWRCKRGGAVAAVGGGEGIITRGKVAY